MSGYDAAMDGVLAVTATTVLARECIPGTVELEALRRWAAPFGFDPGLQPLDCAIVRDEPRRRIYYAVVDDTRFHTSIEDCIRMVHVQLESPPPPWPPEIQRHSLPMPAREAER